MRFTIPAAALMLFAMQAQPVLAQTTTPTTPPSTVAPVPTAPAAAASPSTPAEVPPAKRVKLGSKHVRMTLQQRFDAANTTHDGHLTKEQATTAKWRYVVSHFAAMDSGSKGYVTVAEIHEFASKARAARKAATPAKAGGATAVPATPAP